MGVASQYGNMPTSSNGGGGSTKASARSRGRSLRGGRGKEGAPLNLSEATEQAVHTATVGALFQVRYRIFIGTLIV